MMNNSSTGSGFLSGYTSGILDMNRHQQNPGGILGLNRNHQPNQDGNNPARLQQDNVQPSVDVEYTDEQRQMGLREVKDSNHGGFTMNFGKEKTVGPSNVTINFNDHSSDEGEPSYEDGYHGGTTGAKGKKDAPWQRMKWTDNIVRLLIQVVASVGEDGSFEGADGVRRKSSIIKKGKWKTVSKILISKGYHVSPQQCEDKFNDLNKRYKKLNDILGRGISCKVVENPDLLFELHHLSEKAKEDVKKLLGSKHLFYREICAYHNGQKIPDCSDQELSVRSATVAEQICNHINVSPVAAHCSMNNDSLPVAPQFSKGNNESEDEDAEENDESEDDESDDDSENKGSGSMEKMGEYGQREMMNGQDENYNMQCSRENNFQAEIAEIFNDHTKSQGERKQWIKKRMLQLQEERIGIQEDALELVKQRLKWQRFCHKKELELEMARLEQERLMLENEQKTLQLKHKEVELESRNSEASFVGQPSFALDIMGARGQMKSARHQ